ncbi:hypothetical protein [Pseudomonas capsici]|uniref:hypothetical protein n=1 Tax=Pseudomonas capsici TaxID=2810614 RepID=UPI0021F186F1|nr:hypothetical protein [Pseudomonas capsici]MCV4343762.1 hypothetical protein [Pseudomonas capsici]
MLLAMRVVGYVHNWWNGVSGVRFWPISADHNYQSVSQMLSQIADQAIAITPQEKRKIDRSMRPDRSPYIHNIMPSDRIMQSITQSGPSL